LRWSVLQWPAMASLTGTGIAFDDRGRGEPALLFLPGWCGPRVVFGPLAGRLEDSFRTLAVDWRGHGESKAPEGDFGSAELVDDALAVIDHSGARSVVPVALAHAGWVAIELRRRLGPERVPRLVLVDWMVLGAPPQFLDALAAMANPQTTRAVVDQITAMWVAGLDLPALTDYVASMAAFPDEMWARAARAITASFEQFGAPLEAIAALDPPPPTLHLYAQPPDPTYLEAQRALAADHPWFEVERLDAASHFPTVEVPDAIAGHLAKFVAR
jgi:pimeloyl-ACP methyl ester carboxylesterase